MKKKPLKPIECWMLVAPDGSDRFTYETEEDAKRIQQDYRIGWQLFHLVEQSKFKAVTNTLALIADLSSFKPCERGSNVGNYANLMCAISSAKLQLEAHSF